MVGIHVAEGDMADTYHGHGGVYWGWWFEALVCNGSSSSNNSRSARRVKLGGR